MTTSVITPLLSPLAAVQQLLARFGNRGLIIGGVAASVLGAPRFTADVDVVVILSVGRLPELLWAAGECGLVPRMAEAEQFARRHGVLLLRHEESDIAVDVSLGMLPFEEEAVERGAVHRFGGIELRLPTPEDLIVFKAVAHRPKDLLEIEAIVESHPDLDRERVALGSRIRHSLGNAGAVAEYRVDAEVVSPGWHGWRSSARSTCGRPCGLADRAPGVRLA